MEESPAWIKGARLLSDWPLTFSCILDRKHQKFTEIWMLSCMLTHKFKKKHYYYSHNVGVEPPPSKRPVAHAYCVPWLFASYLWYEKRERVLETHCGLVATCVFLGLSQNQCVRTIWARNTKNWKKNRKTTEIELRNKNYFRRSRSRGRPGFLYGTACDSQRS